MRNKNWIIVSILSLLVFIVFFLLFSSGAILGLDSSVNGSLEAIRSPILNWIMIAITYIMEESVVIILSIILIGILFFMKKIKAIWMYIFSMGLGLVSESLIKTLVHRPRPLNILVHETSFSFPSGHAMFSVIFFLFLLYIFRKDIKNKFLGGLFIFGNIFLILAIGFSRIYLGAHWISDVISGFALGLFWISLGFFVLRKS
jgi:undecaprenyl-diphosphatase